MQKSAPSLENLTDTQLIVEVKALAASERQATAALIAALAELDARRLYLGEGFRSLFTYCTRCLHLSEHAAYNRIEAARAVRKWPAILEQLSDGSLTLTTISMVARHLTKENYRAVLDAVRHQSKREVEQLVAKLEPRPDVPTTVRKLPAPKAPTSSSQSALTTVADAPVAIAAVPVPASPPTPAPGPMPAVTSAPPVRRPAIVAPLAPERYKVQFTVSRETHDKLRRVQDLMRHAVPNGDPAEIFDRALTLLLEHIERTKLAAARRPRVPRSSQTESRHIPAAVKRAVWNRDGARCAFVGTEGQCAERGFLEFHHVEPHARGGAATEANIQLRCRAHNQHEAEVVFGTRPLLVRERLDCPKADRGCHSVYEKLLRRVGTPVVASGGSTTRLGDWCGTLFGVGPRRLVLFLSEHSRLPVFMPAHGLKSVGEQLPLAVGAVLMSLGVPGPLGQAELAEMRDVVIAPTNNRSLVGSLNDFVHGARCRFEMEPATALLTMSVWLSDTPVGPMKYEAPGDVTRRLFGLPSLPRRAV